MTAFYQRMNLRRRTARFATCIMVFAASVVAAHAQTPPYAEFQYSTLTASGNTITGTMLPVVTTNGTSYVNVVMQFDVAADGTLTIAPGYPQIAPSPRPSTRNFLAGNYVGPSADANYDITVFGPGVTAGGATEWSLATSTGATCYTTPTTATWYVFSGPMAQNPLAGYLKKAGITEATYGAYSWGITGDQCAPTVNWATENLIGLSQTNGALTILNFTYNGVYQSQPADQITYMKTNQ
jgi:hypothetical protein